MSIGLESIGSLEGLGVDNFIIAFSSIKESIFISKGGIGGLKGLDVGNFFSAFSSRERLVLMAR
jgi:hypothetical protein